MSTTPGRSPSPTRLFVPLIAPVLVVLGMAVATHSVVRYKLWIVATYAVLAVLLAVWVARGDSGGGRARGELASSPPGLKVLGGSLAGTLALVAVLHLRVRPYTYLTAGDGWVVRGVYAGGAVLAAGALVAGVLVPRLRSIRAGRRVSPFDAALAIAVVAYVVAAVLLIHLDPKPKIDVWITLQQAADGIARGANIYSLNWTGSPGVQDAFTYLPFTALLLAPGRWLAGDVRWALVVITLLGVLAVRLLGEPVRDETGSRAPAARLAAVGAAVLLLLMPGTPTQVEQAWTEPLLMACLAGWALGVRRRNDWLAIGCFALGLASKQHLAVLLPILAAWPRFGPRRTLLTAVLGGLFVLPWFIASPADIWHDTVTVLVNFQPLVFADTLYIAAINDLHRTPPFWLTGLAVLAVLVAAVVTVRRRNPDLAVVLRWFALMLLVANLVNKQAFYNQYWLVAALVVMSFAVPRSVGADGEVSPARSSRPRAGAEA
jgi:hypothetical protein